MNNRKTAKAAILAAFLATSEAALAWTAFGFNDGHPDISNDTTVLRGYAPNPDYFLRQAELPAQGANLSIRIDNRFPIVVHSDHQIKGCAIDGGSISLIACNTPYDRWQNIKLSRQRTPVPGVELYTPFIDETRKLNADIMIGLGPDRLLTIDQPNQVILSLSDSFLSASDQFETQAGAFHFRAGAYLGAARTFDAFVGGKTPLFPCDLAYGACDEYKDGALVQTAAYYLTAANSCLGCTAKDKAVLFNMGLRVLTGAPADALIDAVELRKKYPSVIQKTIVPEALIKRLQDKQLLKVGMSPRIDD